MGIMEKMRNSTPVILWILIISFGLLWVLADTQFFDAIQAGPRSLGSVNGEEISLEEYNERINYFTDMHNQQDRGPLTPEVRANYENQAWEEIVNTKLIQQKMDELGIAVTDQEVVNMITGNNPAPFIRQQFQTEDGTIDRTALQAAIEAPENSEIWVMIEQELRQQRRQQKMSTFIESGLRVSERDIERTYRNNNTYADVSYIRFPYADISEEEVEVTESDLREYYDNNQDRFNRKKSYEFEYVGFDKTPTAEDTARTFTELSDLRDDFAEAEDEESFLERYQSVSSYSDEYVNKDDLREEFTPVLDIEVGEVTDVIDRGSQVSILKKLDENEEEVQFVNLTLNIEADPVSTIDARAEEADDFSFYAEEEGFQAEAERQGREIQTAFATEDNNFIAGLGQSQQIMNFLETASTGDLSEPLELNDQFVVLRVTNIIPEGVRPFSEVESQIRNIVVTEKRKELMEQRVRELLESADSLEELAEAAGREVTQVDNLRMGSAIIQGGGREPQVIGAIFGYDEDELSDPLRGNNAVFVTRIDSRTEADLSDLDASDRRELRRELEEAKSSSFTAVWLDRLKEQADITDNRSRMLQ